MRRAGDRATVGRPVGRRQFLTLAGAGVTLAARSPRAAQRAADADTIVVVGGGLAGLQAATILRQAGRTVIVLEARSAPGGRVRTLRTPFSEGLYAEAGPIRIPGMHRTVLELARAHGLSLVPFVSTTGSPVIRLRGVTARVPDDLTHVTKRLALTADEVGLGQAALLQRYVRDLPDDIGAVDATAQSYARWQSLDRVTWPAWLRARGASPDAVTLMTLGGDSSQLSALYVLRQFALLQGTDQFFKIQGGMDQLPRAMAAGLGPVVRYGAVVVAIDRTTSPVRVEYRAQGRSTTVTASHVVLAVPFSTLRRIDVRPVFGPAKAAAIGSLRYFPASRILVETKVRFWEKAHLTGTARTDHPAEIWDCTYDVPATGGILGATVGGALGASLAGMSRARAAQAGAGVVATTFRDSRAHLRPATVYRWALDPWSRGAFAVFHPGQMTALMPDIARPEGTIHFAGEHTSSWMGWMEGALQSGERAAAEILGQHTVGGAAQ